MSPPWTKLYNGTITYIHIPFLIYWVIFLCSFKSFGTITCIFFQWEIWSWSFSFTGLIPLAMLSYFPLLSYFPWLSAQVEEILKFDRFLSPHYRYFTRELRIIAYTQLLESYRSLTLDYMANAFGVTTEFVDQWVLIGLDVRENCIQFYQSEQDWKFFLM